MSWTLPGGDRPLVLVGVGGFAGASLRHLATVALQVDFHGTLLVNVVGCFLLGLVLSETRRSGVLSAETRLLVGTGFLSSFTTYSTFALQTASLPPTLAATNVAANYLLGFLAVGLAQLVGRWVW